jgi:putative peptide zinc metalloprotease protein
MKPMNLRRMIAIPLLVLGFLWSIPVPASASDDNAALAINTKDDTYRWKRAFRVTRVSDTTVDSANVAWAQSSCERCRTAAVAVQIVLITGDADTVTPANLAFAINQECDTCATYAGAWQFVVTTGQPVHFTEAGSAKIEQIKEDLKVLLEGATFGPTFEEIDAFNQQVDALVSQLDAVLETEIVKNGSDGRVEEMEESDLAA